MSIRVVTCTDAEAVAEAACREICAAAVAAWLLHTGRAERVDEAIERLRRERPTLVLYDAHRLALLGKLAALLHRRTQADEDVAAGDLEMGQGGLHQEPRP